MIVYKTFRFECENQQNPTHRSMKIEKTRVTNGVYWVHIPEINLRILCGCPADSVKHLMNCGFVVERNQGEVTYESGPNAVLLSDILIQNGMFSNLAEFPVLQMLYRQGMILPNHPNNDGSKPLLIGSPSQIKSQLAYIYRGNYGLISLDEIKNSGVADNQADIYMKIKLEFAFGQIREASSLIDTLKVDRDTPAEIKEGCHVQRKALNVFEISYQGESVEIDLNLKSGESYSPPYQLGYHEVNREYFSVIHSGEGDGWDVKRPCMGSIVMFQGKIYLIDAGPNILYSLTALGIAVNEVEGVFHTHSHDDHFAGIPTLMRSGHRIKYYATKMVRHSVMKKLSALLDTDEKEFTRYFEIHDLDFDSWNNVNGLEVKPIYSPHPVETSFFIFRAHWANQYYTYAHLADIIALPRLRTILDKQKTNNSREKDDVYDKFYDKIKSLYLTHVDLKKIDIGGGLIHGAADDFIEDESHKIIFSHINRDLFDHEKEIGSEAPFATTEVLIPTRSNYHIRYAESCLYSYFPDVAVDQIETLLNGRINYFNAGSILLKKGAKTEYVYLILSGNVEQIQVSTVGNVFSAGAFLGELSSILEVPLESTFRAASSVKVLEIHSRVYYRFVRQNGLYDSILRISGNREFLKSTWLFCEAIPYSVQNQLSLSLHSYYVNAGERLNEYAEGVHLLRQGVVEIIDKSSDKTHQEIRAREFWGEYNMLEKEIPYPYYTKAKEKTEICFLRAEHLLDIPIVRWKLLESHSKHTYKLSKSPTQV